MYCFFVDWYNIGFFPFMGKYTLFGPVRAMGELMSCVQSLGLGAHMPRLPGFILLGDGFAVLKGLLIVPVGTMGSF